MNVYVCMYDSLLSDGGGDRRYVSPFIGFIFSDHSVRIGGKQTWDLKEGNIPFVLVLVVVL